MNKCQFPFLFSATVQHFKEPSSLQNLIFMLVGLNVMAPSNFDANSKKMREAERILSSRSQFQVRASISE